MEYLEKQLEYKFKNFSLLETALTHSSYANLFKEQKECNERLEFLGDAVLQIIVSEYLYKKYPKEREGVLSKARVSIVCEDSLNITAKKLNLNKYLLTSRSGTNDITNKPSVLADTVEAIIGALFLDGGYEVAQNFIYNHILTNEVIFHDWKSELLEYLQSINENLPTFKTIEEKGPEHNKIFVVNMLINDIVVSKGIGTTKKSAQKEAAKNYMLEIKNNI